MIRELLPNGYQPDAGGSSVLDQECPTCGEPERLRCLDLRRSGWQGVIDRRLRPHPERRVRRGDAGRVRTAPAQERVH